MTASHRLWPGRKTYSVFSQNVFWSFKLSLIYRFSHKSLLLISSGLDSSGLQILVKKKARLVILKCTEALSLWQKVHTAAEVLYAVFHSPPAKICQVSLTSSLIASHRYNMHVAFYRSLV